MSYALLSLFVVVALEQAADASATKHTQKHPTLQQGPQHQASLLSKQQLACSNLLEINELHGEWLEGSSDLKAGLLTLHHLVQWWRA